MFHGLCWKYYRNLYWKILERDVQSTSFTSRLRIFHLYGDFTIAGEGLQNLGLCSALRAFEQGRIFIVPHLLWQGASVFPVSSEGPPHLVACMTHKGVWRIYSSPDPQERASSLAVVDLEESFTPTKKVKTSCKKGHFQRRWDRWGWSPDDETAEDEVLAIWGYIHQEDVHFVKN
jgi:hypothetical protein